MSSAFEGLPKTPNLKLNKPGYDNVADIEALNENADILDAEIQGIKNTFVKSVNGKEPDAGGNVNVEEYTHPNSGVTAGTYRSVTVNAQGHVTAGSNPTLAIADGGTGATTASQACANLGAVQTVNDTPPDENGNVNVAGVPVGFEYFSTNPNIPVGSIPLFGGEYSRTTYSDLWEWVQTQAGYLLTEEEWQAKASANDGNVPFYSDGDGSTTFRVPSLKCWVKGANGIEEVGSYLSAGLPNITGQTNYTAWGSGGFWSGSQSGALYATNQHTSYHADSSGNDAGLYHDIAIDASRSNSIYGNSNTVQPKSIVGMWLVKAYGTVTNVGNLDIANIAQGLTQTETRISAIENNKVDKAGNAWIVETYRNGTEWYRVWSDGWVEQGGYKALDSTGTVTFLKPFQDTNYTVTVSSQRTSNNGFVRITALTATTISFMFEWDAGQSKSGYGRWYACGQGA